jgi:NADPH:quinone reductase-like Zn-dependent oxidoreductase
LQALGVQPSLVLLNADTSRYVKEVATHLAPFAQIGSVVESVEPIPIHDQALFYKSVSFHWRMPTKWLFNVDVETQGVTITRLAQLVADGTILSMVTKHEPLTLSSIREGHKLQESGTVIGKLVFTVGNSLA